MTRTACHTKISVNEVENEDEATSSIALKLVFRLTMAGMGKRIPGT